MLSFVNARRAAAGKSAVTLGGTALLSELRAQLAECFVRAALLGHVLKCTDDLHPAVSGFASRT